MIRSAIVLAVLAPIVACGQSENVRARTVQERAAANAIVAGSEIVQSSRTPQDSGRLIYDKPIDLSYSTLRKTRPDLDSARASPGSAGVAEPARRRP